MFGSDFKPVNDLLAIHLIDRNDREYSHQHLLEVDELDASSSSHLFLDLYHKVWSLDLRKS